MESTGKSGETEFAEKVKKTFGNLFASISPSPSSLSNPLWSLTGTQVEKREWRRDQDSSDRDNNPCASSFDDFVSCARENSRKNLKSYKKEFNDDEDMQHLDVGDNDDDDGKVGDLDDWDVRGSIGLDSTLDYEAEEDAYDKVAIGREDDDDRLYMGAVANNNIPKPVSLNDLSPASQARLRDPRANRWAAKLRLEEDDAEVGLVAGYYTSAQAPPTNPEKEPVTVKPILKRKDHESTSKPLKRVRFDPQLVKDSCGCLKAPVFMQSVKHSCTGLSDEENKGGQIPSDNKIPVNQSGLDENVRRVPDYVQNPSKYTCYSLDSTDEMNDKSNTKSCLENSGSQSEVKDVITDLPNSITFVPKKKSDSAEVEELNSDFKHSSTKSTLVASLVDEDIQESEVGNNMEVDEPVTNAESGINIRNQSRQYRAKSHADEPE